MRYLISILAAGLILTSFCLSQESYQDVIYFKNGIIMRGTIIETIPEKSVKLQTRDGNIHLFELAEIARIRKEAAPWNASEQKPQNEIESWYLYFAFGVGKARYPDPLQQVMDELGSISETPHLGIGFDMIGVYLPLHDNHTIIGGVFNGIMDSYMVSENSSQMNQYLISFSSLHFLTDEIGHGIFIRGDVGIAWLNAKTSQGGSISSSAGFGILVGCGYAFAISKDAMTLNLDYGMRWVEGESYGVSNIKLGFLF